MLAIAISTKHLAKAEAVRALNMDGSRSTPDAAGTMAAGR